MKLSWPKLALYSVMLCNASLSFFGSSAPPAFSMAALRICTESQACASYATIS